MEEWLSHLAGQPHEEEVDDDTEDFYGYNTNSNGDAKAGAMETVRSGASLDSDDDTDVPTIGRARIHYLSMATAKEKQPRWNRTQKASRIAKLRTNGKRKCYAPD